MSAHNQPDVADAVVEMLKKRHQAEKFLDNILNFKPLVSSRQSLSRFMDVFVSSVNGLKALELENLSEYILYSLTLRKLDHKTRGGFNAIVIHENLTPTVNDLVKYVEKQRHIQDIVSQCQQDARSSGRNKREKRASDQAPTSGNEDGSKQEVLEKNVSSNSRGRVKKTNWRERVTCLECQTGNHPVETCALFLKFNAYNRRRFAQVNKICTNCLNANHSAYYCQVKNCCEKCSNKHHILLHREKSAGSNTRKTFTNSNRNKLSKTDSNHVENNDPNNSLVHDNNHNIADSSKDGKVTQSRSYRRGTSKRPIAVVDEKTCFVCGQDFHNLLSCVVFNNFDSEKCLNLIKQKKLCANCFGHNHRSFKCPNESNCDQCKAKHHSKLHLTYGLLKYPAKQNLKENSVGNRDETARTSSFNELDGKLPNHDTICNDDKGVYNGNEGEEKHTTTSHHLGAQLENVCKIIE